MKQKTFEAFASLFLRKTFSKDQYSITSTAFARSILLASAIFISFVANAQVIMTYDFAAPTAYNATSKGYEKPAVGTYFRGTNGGTITFGTNSCYGYSISAPTGSSLFIFQAVKDVNSIVIKAYSGSNRTFNNFATSATLNGTYTNGAYTTSGSIGSNNCGMITVTPAAPIVAGTFMRFTISGNINVTSIDIDYVPTGTPPTVTTNSVTPGQASATVNGTVTPGTMPLKSSGIIWSTNALPLDTTLATQTRNTPSATTTFNDIASNLIPGTSYFTRAYVIDAAKNVYYGASLPFATNPATKPTLTTVAVNNIAPFKANSGGSNIDSGGLKITGKGVCWSTSPAPTARLGTRTSDGANGTNFSSLMRVLQPGTQYYVRAYAINAVDTGYGNEIQFTTPAATPYLVAVPTSLNFGSIAYNSSASVLNYKLSGYALTPANGTITVAAPTGFTISLNPSTGFAATANVPYTNGTFTNNTIYVKFSTASYGNYNANIAHSGGGTVASNTDSVNVKGVVIPDPNVTTNAGTDFWTGFGMQERMDQPSGDADETKMSLYISVPVGSPAAVVNVELPGIPGATGWPKQNITVNPGTVTEITGFPTGDPGDETNPNGMPDARLYYTGVSKRGIHIYSTNGVPVSAWMHTYAQNNSAAGAMLFPTNTWNNAYTVQAYGANSNQDFNNSYFFVVANEDNTPIWFTPSVDIVDSSTGTIFNDNHTAAMIKYAKNVEHGPIMLNKGQVFNAMGYIQGGVGLDLTGSKVRTTCDKKIAVFGGNGRCLVNALNCSASSGSDHMIQQMFPSVAWGTKYITVPTKTMEYNLFRITVNDPATKVWVNNPTHTTPLPFTGPTGLINNLYYQISTNTPLLIESDKPINVTQFIVAGQCNTSKGGKGDGDPEMIILSPVQQAINNVTAYSATIKKTSPGANGHYINVVIPQGGIASFRLDGLVTADTGINQATANATTCYNTGGIIPIANAFQPHPNAAGYYYAKFRVSAGAAHRLYSDSNFVAIAYGMGSGESYGYNAGTNIKDLTKPLFIDNPYLPNVTTNTTCTNNPVKLKAVLPYAPAQVSSITWYMSQVQNVSPQTDVTINNPTSDSTYTTDGVQYYVYKNPTVYTFGSAGSYNITGQITGTFASQCGSSSPFSFNINIADPGFADFNISYNPCIDDTVRLTDQSNGNGFNVVNWRWEFGDGEVDTVKQNPSHFYAVHSNYTIKLRAINAIGCYADTTKTFDMTSELKAKFGVRDTICAGSAVTYTDSSANVGIGGSIVKWTWNFGEGAPVIANTNASQNHIYNTPGDYYPTLEVETAGGCKALFKDTITVRPNPVADFIPPAGVCLPGATNFTNTTTINDTTINTVTYLWNFGDASATSIIKNPSHTFPNTTPPTGGYSVVLTATSKYGCAGTKTIALTAVFPKPTVAFTAPTKVCLSDSARFQDNSSGTGQVITKWYWTFGDGTTDTVKNPAHLYGASGSYNVTLAVQSDKGCASDTSAPFIVKVNPLPVADFTLPGDCLNSATVTFNDLSNITPDDGTQKPFTYAWTFGDPGSGANNNATSQNGTHTYTATGTYQVILIATSAQGCKDSDTASYTITSTKPTSSFNVVNALGLCSNKQVSVQHTSTVAIGTMNKVEIIWDTVGAPGVIDTYNNPTTGQQFNHSYPDFQTPATKDFWIKYRTFTSATCFDDTLIRVTVNASPKVQLLNIAGICFEAAPRQLTQGSQLSSLPGSFTYSGTGVVAPDFFNAQTAGVGTHQIQYLWVTNAGCRDSISKPIKVWASPIAKFGVSNPTCEKNNITFSDSSATGVGNITSWTWNFGDGTGNVVKNNNTPFTYQYNTAAPYTVTLKVVTDSGCTNPTAASRVVTVNPLPQVGFILPVSICLPDGRGTFTDTSKIADGSQGSFTYRWDFGDGGMSLIKSPDHQYTAVGPYDVKLIVTSNNGCKDSLTKPFSNVYPQPVVSAITDPSGAQVCLGDSIQFIDQTSTAVKWAWQFGDAITDTTQTPWHTYTQAGNYTASLTIWDNRGCISNVHQIPVIIDGYPELELDSIVYVLEGSSVVLNPHIVGAGDDMTYLWTPNRYLSNDTIKNPVSTPLSDQPYYLTLTNGLGCSVTDTMEVRLYRKPRIPNAFSPNKDGINDVWYVEYLNTYSEAKVEIFDRYGRVVYVSTGYNKPWDGTVKGRELPVGTYYYVIHLGVVKQPLTGWITLLK